MAAGIWWRKNPSACPYSQRFWVDAPHPLITRERLRDVLAPADGDRIFEIGPGTGYYTLDMATWVGRPGRSRSSTSSRSSSTTRWAARPSAG